MERGNIISVLEGLANGVDPVTGELLPATSPYNHPEVIRALFHAVNLISNAKKPKKTMAEKQQENVNNGLPQNHGLPWDEKDVQAVISQFQSNSSFDAINDIAFKFSRKPNSIFLLLKKHEAISPELAIMWDEKF